MYILCISHLSLTFLLVLSPISSRRSAPHCQFFSPKNASSKMHTAKTAVTTAVTWTSPGSEEFCRVYAMDIFGCVY